MSEQTIHQKLITMLQMQDEMNRRVDHDWIEKDREWYRAIWIECAELMDHYGGWKWWKHSRPDVEQVMLEIVDIWHFGLSMHIDNDRNYAHAAEEIAERWHSPISTSGFLDDVETLAAAALADKQFLVDAIPSLLQHIGREFDDLYRAYIGKNVLNFFRQDHGYKEGSYVKQWQGREDNEHLVEILNSLDVNAAGFQDSVYAHLKMRYAG